MSRLMRGEKVLNWLIALLALSTILRHEIGTAYVTMTPAIAIVAIVLIAWTCVIAYTRLRQASTHPNAPRYSQIETSDYSRLFFALLAGHWPIGGNSTDGFWVFTLFAIALLAVVVTIALVDIYLHHRVTNLAIGIGVFAYFLLAWEKNVLIQHYGVPIMGHFLERPEYNTTHLVTVSDANDAQRTTLVADIHVVNKSESEEVGEDWYGQPTYRSFDYRQIWVNALQLPSGQKISVSQYEPLDDDGWGTVMGDRGQVWQVKLLQIKEQ